MRKHENKKKEHISSSSTQITQQSDKTDTHQSHYVKQESKYRQDKKTLKNVKEDSILKDYCHVNEEKEKTEKHQSTDILTESLEFIGSDGQCYCVKPTVTQKEAEMIKKQAEIMLIRTESGFSSYLGEGQYGQVYVAIRKQKTEDTELKKKNLLDNQQQFYAVKIIKGNKNKLIESLHESEIQTLLLTKQVDSNQSHIMPLIDAVKIYEGQQLICLYYVFPLAALGNVETISKQINSLENKKLKRLLSWHIANGLLLGLWQMHQKNIYHLDVKLANLLVDFSGRILLGDFGTSEKIDTNPPLLTPHKNEEGRYIGNGDSRYFPPERSDHAEPHPNMINCANVDIFSAGAALWEIVTGETYPGTAEKALCHPKLEHAPSNSLANLITYLIQPIPEDRWTLEQALNHDIFKKTDIHDSQIMAVVLDFLKRFVQQLQYIKNNPNLNLSLNELAQAMPTELKNQLDNKVKTIREQFLNRTDLPQTSLYIDLQGALTQKVENPEKECFFLEKKVNEFLNDSKKAVLALLADGGSGKSFFVKRLVLHLWEKKSNQYKPILPLYVELNRIQYPDKLLKEAFRFTHNDLENLQLEYQLLLIADGYDEQDKSNWINLYNKNELHKYDFKLIVNCRLNLLPHYYSFYFEPQVIEGKKEYGYQEIYIQPFDLNNIDSYIEKYIRQNQNKLEEYVKNNRLTEEWLNKKIYQQKLEAIAGLKELATNPFMCHLILQALLAQLHMTQIYLLDKKESQKKITRIEVYEAFLTQWIVNQIAKQKNIKPTTNEIWKTGQAAVMQLYKDNRALQIDTSSKQFFFDPSQGYYKEEPHAWNWLMIAREIFQCLPLQEVQKGQFRFLHLSIQEFLLARSFYQALKSDDIAAFQISWNSLLLTVEEKDQPILYLLGDYANFDLNFRVKLFNVIYQTKMNKRVARAAANAITVLNAAGVQFIANDFSNIDISQANLSGMISHGNNWSGANLTNVNLQAAWLYSNHFIKAQLSGIHFYEYPNLNVRENIKCICYSPNGRLLAVACENAYMGNIYIYEADSRKLLFTLANHLNVNLYSPVTSICFSPDSLLLVSGGADCTIKVWDLRSGKLLRTLWLFSKFVSPNCLPFSVSISPDSEIVASGCMDGNIRVWNRHTGKLIYNLKGHEDSVLSICFSPTGTILSGSKDKTIRLWNPSSGKLLSIFKGHENNVTSVYVSPDGKSFASGSLDKTIRIWNLETLKLIYSLDKHTDGINSICISRHGKILASASSDGTVRLWDYQSGKLIHTIQGNAESIGNVSISPDNSTIILTGSRNTYIQFQDLRGGKPLHRRVLENYSERVESVCISSDSTTLMIGNSDKIVQLIDLRSGKLIKTNLQKRWGNSIENITISTNGAYLVSRNFVNTVQVVDLWSEKSIHSLEKHKNKIIDICVSANGMTLACVEEASTPISNTIILNVWDLHSKTLLYTLEEKSYTTDRLLQTGYRKGRFPDKMGISPDGVILVWNLGGCSQIEVVTLNSRKVLYKLNNNKPHLYKSLNFSADSKTFAMGNDKGFIFVWDIYTGNLRHTLQKHNDAVNCISFLPDDNTLLSGSSDSTIRLWNLFSGECLHEFELVGTIHNLALKDVEGNKYLAVSFSGNIACFRLQKNYFFSLEWICLNGNKVVLKRIDITGALGLSQSIASLFKYYGATGEPAQIIDERKHKKESSNVAITDTKKNLFKRAKNSLKEHRGIFRKTELPKTEEEYSKQQTSVNTSPKF